MTTRGPAGDDRADHEAGGLGLGLFIAKTLLERTGARLTFGNREPPKQRCDRAGRLAARAHGCADKSRSRGGNHSMTNGLRAAIEPL